MHGKENEIRRFLSGCKQGEKKHSCTNVQLKRERGGEGRRNFEGTRNGERQREEVERLLEKRRWSHADEERFLRLPLALSL